MNIFYSAVTRSFYDSTIHPLDTIPEGSVEITKETHQLLIDGQCEGQEIVPNVDGYPILKDREPLSEEDEIAEWNQSILRQIQFLEADKQPRAMREFLIDNDTTRLEALNAEIDALRNQMK